MIFTEITLQGEPGEDIADVIDYAITITEEHNCSIKVPFNGVVIWVEQGDDFEDAYAKYRRFVG